MEDLRPTPQHNKRKLTRMVGFLCVGLGLVVLSYPLWPILRYKLAGPVSTPEAPVFPYPSRLLDAEQNLVTPGATPTNAAPTPATTRVKAKVKSNAVPTTNRLVIPKIGVDLPIAEGTNEEKALNLGAWRIPGSSVPPEGGNTVLSAHRFRYRPPSNLTLYLLDQVKPGDIMIIYWQGKEYDFQVRTTKVVPRTQTDIAEPTLTPQLTVFTCHPVFSTKNRLVVVGELL